MTQSLKRSHTILNGLCISLFIILFSSRPLSAQKDSTVTENDTIPPAAQDSFFLLKKKGILGRLARSIVANDTTGANDIQRIDVLYRKYTGRIIRNIEVRAVDFGIPINDTSRSFKNMLTKLADDFHQTTRTRIIRNNLFFKENDSLLPILLADNERHLRDQPYLNDAKIIVKSVLGTRDSVDVIVLTKDVLSLGGKFRMSSLNKIEVAAREENFAGLGNRVMIGTYYDSERRRQFGFSGEYIARNIKGTFTDGYIGFQQYAPTFNTFHRQETNIYGQLIKPLVNPYMKWTYALDAAWHKNHNMYADTVYDLEGKYEYYNIDAWVGYNMSASKISGSKEKDDRLRTMVGLRFIHQEFLEIPQKYETEYYFQYANLTGILASISVFRQDFYKTRFVYGFGRNEDVPEGLDFSVTTGWTNKQQRIRPYMGLDMSFNYFTKKESYFNYTLRIGTYNYKRKYEDISLLANLEYFSRLKNMGTKWKQRTFINAGVGTQWNKQLNEPMLLESQYGLPEYENIFLGGDHRLTVKAESVFFSPWTLANFRFAPFVFGNGSFLTPVGEPIGRSRLYSTIGGGVRSRNEALIFGTLELKAYYFPTKNFNGDRFRFEFNTSVKFKYNNQFIKRPQFIQIN